LINPQLNPGQIILYYLKARRVIDQLQWHLIVQVRAGLPQPVLSQPLTTENIGGVLQGLGIWDFRHRSVLTI
jgi:hypothetical protein